jgi:hypothetical protein
MLVPLPNLDDRRWSELVEEGRALIPVYDQTWSDHNIHDPGIMLVELLAWVAEMDIYWLNRVPEDHLRKFLALAGIAPAGPRPAGAALQILLEPDADPVALPAGLVFEGQDALQKPVPFRSLHPVTLAPGKLAAILRQQDRTWSDLTAHLNRGEAFAPFGDDPAAGSTFHLGFTHPLPVGEPVSLGFTVAGERVGAEERQRLLDWLRHRSHLCQAPPGLVECDPDDECPSYPGLTCTGTQRNGTLEHHSVRLQWEYLDSDAKWQPLDPQAGQVWDDSRGLSLNGRVVVRLPGEMASHLLGEPERLLYWLRCRIVEGAYDAPPSITSLAFNAVLVEQAANLGAQTWMIASDAEITGPEPQRGEPVGFSRLQFSSSGWIERLGFEPGQSPGYRLLAYRPPQNGQPGQIVLQAETLDAGNGKPCQVRTLAHVPLLAESLALYTLENGRWVAWTAAADLDAAGPADARFILDATLGEIHFGDGQNGRVLPAGVLPLVSYDTTRAWGGNLPSNAIQALPVNPHNRMLTSGVRPIARWIGSITNPLPAIGGEAAESVEDAAARLLAQLDRPQRAVTLGDIRWLAFDTPGVRLARVTAIPNVHPAYPCMQAPGVVTVIVLPYLPAGQPQPSPGLIQSVRAYLSPRRVLGTRVVVVGPRYTEVSVRASVQASNGVNLTEVRDRVDAALDRFFDPLVGGPNGDGWPFGRDIYRTEVLQVIDETPGVEHVLSLELVDGDGEPGCGNLCIGPLSLVAAGEHEIEVQ